MLNRRGVPAWIIPVLAGAGSVAGACALAAIVAPGEDAMAGARSAAVATVLLLVIKCGVFVGAYLVAALGFGCAIGRAAAGTAALPISLRAALGLAAMLWLSHLLGVFGVLGSAAGAWAPVAIGVLLAGALAAWGELRPERWPAMPWWSLAAAPVVAVMIAAACSPPGWLWRSEFGGYDVMSYHLQLPKEWLAPSGGGGAGGAGAIAPLAHNVYSYLPSYMEAAYTHMLSLMTLGAGGDAITADDGAPVIACQMLHVAVTVLAAVLVAGAASAMAGRLRGAAGGTPAPREDVGGGEAGRMPVPPGGAAVGACALLATPWVVVVASIAYNEGAVLAMFAGALLAAADWRLADRRRGLVCGLLVGAACSAKPSSFVMVAPAVAVALAIGAPRRAWPVIGAGAVAGGAVMVAPWLIRNAAHGGNPVFPFGAGVFGAAHWSAEQVARYAGAHDPDGSMARRVGLLFSSARGLLHPQWSALPIIGVAAIAWGLGARATRAWAAALGGMTLLCVLAWLLVGHQQSRFLLPAAVPLCIAIGLGGSLLVAQARAWGISKWQIANDQMANGKTQSGEGKSMASPRTARPWHPSQGVAAAALAAIPVSLGGWSIANYMRQSGAGGGGGGAGGGLIGGAAALTGQSAEAAIDLMPPAEAREAIGRSPSPEVFTRLALGGDPGAGVFLLGDAAPFYYTAAVLYHTTWDASPLAGVDVTEWSERLASRGVTHVVVSFSELSRLMADGWYDPAIAPDAVSAWVATLGPPTMTWPRGAPSVDRALFALPGSGAGR